VLDALAESERKRTWADETDVRSVYIGQRRVRAIFVARELNVRCGTALTGLGSLPTTQHTDIVDSLLASDTSDPLHSANEVKIGGLLHKINQETTI